MIRSSLLTLFFCLFSLASFSQQQDKARDGEGIYSFLRRNNCTSPEQYKEFIELNKDKLGKNNSLLKGVSYRLPAPIETTALTSSDNGKYINKLFGETYQEYTVKSDKLKGACFFLSSGHGGPDPGAISKVDGYSLHEDEYAYDVSLRLAKALLEEGATVHMIIQDELDGIRDDKYLPTSDRETCMGEAIPLGQLQRLKQRSNKINTLAKQSKEKYKRCVFIHVDSRSQKKQLDVFFYYANESSEGQKLSETMNKTFEEHYAKHQPDRGFSGTVGERNLYVLRKTRPVGIYAELGNIQNSFDQKRFLDPNNRQALANWMCRGFIKDYENWKEGK